MIRILAIEDHWMVVDGLRSRFRADRDQIMISFTAGNVKQALSEDPESFDLILLDLLIPGTDPVENVRKLKQKYPQIPIVILTSEERSVWENQMCKAGVQAYITKDESRKNLKEAIIRVAGGEDLCKQKMSAIAGKTKAEDGVKPVFFLKPSEKAILTLYSKENNLKEIAARMFMTESAVAKVMARLRKQFSVKSNAVLLLFVIENKLI